MSRVSLWKGIKNTDGAGAAAGPFAVGDVVTPRLGPHFRILFWQAASGH